MNAHHNTQEMKKANLNATKKQTLNFSISYTRSEMNVCNETNHLSATELQQNQLQQCQKWRNQIRFQTRCTMPAGYYGMANKLSVQYGS